VKCEVTLFSFLFLIFLIFTLSLSLYSSLFSTTTLRVLSIFFPILKNLFSYSSLILSLSPLPLSSPLSLSILSLFSHLFPLFYSLSLLFSTTTLPVLSLSFFFIFNCLMYNPHFFLYSSSLLSFLFRDKCNIFSIIIY
jgi:hypothetical protein